MQASWPLQRTGGCWLTGATAEVPKWHCSYHLATRHCSCLTPWSKLYFLSWQSQGNIAWKRPLRGSFPIKQDLAGSPGRGCMMFEYTKHPMIQGTSLKMWPDASVDVHNSITKSVHRQKYTVDTWRSISVVSATVSVWLGAHSAMTHVRTHTTQSHGISCYSHEINLIYWFVFTNTIFAFFPCHTERF